MVNKHYVESLGHQVLLSFRNGLDAIAAVKKT